MRYIHIHPFLELNCDLMKNGYTQQAASQKIGISYAGINAKMNLHSGWTLYEAYQLCLLSGHSLEELPVLFPLEAVNKAEADRRKKINESHSASNKRRSP